MAVVWSNYLWEVIPAKLPAKNLLKLLTERKTSHNEIKGVINK